MAVVGALLAAAVATGPAPAQTAPAAGDRAPGGGCSDVTVSGAPPIAEGGCGLDAGPSPVTFSVLTMAGRVPFQTCDLQLLMRISDRGDVASSGYGTADVGRGDGACDDIIACRWEGGDPKRLYDLRELVPWQGTIERAGGGRYRIVLDTCLNTCIGRFEGKLELMLVESRKGWRAVARDASIGASGLRLDGSMGVEWERGSAPPTLPG